MWNEKGQNIPTTVSCGAHYWVEDWLKINASTWKFRVEESSGPWIGFGD